MKTFGGGARHNPFSSARVQPGAIPYFLPPTETLETLYRRFLQHGASAQLVAPHGHGKSTLVFHLCARAKQDGWRVVPYRGGPVAGEPRTLYRVDGVEQISVRDWRRLKEACANSDVGLLATAHKDCGLPTLWTPRVDAASLRTIIDYLLRDEPTFRIDDAALETLLRKHSGNMRLVLLELYHRYEIEFAAQ
jgi:hypothetical protein